MGANHNSAFIALSALRVVSNVPKILKWEQITTRNAKGQVKSGCFQCSKDTKMGANHNGASVLSPYCIVVSNVPKILKWEQITTDR